MTSYKFASCLHVHVCGQEKERKERSGGSVSRHYKVYTKKAKQVGVVSSTGPVVAGRLDETMGVRKGGSMGSNDPPSPKRGHLHH